MNSKVKVLVVDDSAFMRKLITNFLSENKRIIVIGTARNGEDCLEKIKKYKPDVITMDIEMPAMNGLEALKVIMKTSPLPVIMLSSTTSVGTENTMIASMQEGAFDFVAKPSGPISLDLEDVKDELIEKILAASTANLKKRRVGIGSNQSFIVKETKGAKKFYKDSTVGQKSIVCIGTSTGGPRALQKVLTKLPEEIGAPIFIVQHMPVGFTKSFANRLNSLCKVYVKEAEDGEIVENNTVYIAPGGIHLEVKEKNNQLFVALNKQDPRMGHRPSVDVMLESVGDLSTYRKIAVIMTGMGSDGTEGLKKIKSSSTGFAIAESKNTAIIYGMPKSAASTNLVDEIVDLEQITDTIMMYLHK